MFTIMLPATDGQSEVVLHLEHSLVSLSNWEAEHEVPFFGKEQKQPAEMLSYISHMLLFSPPEENWISRLQEAQFLEITNYINSKQSATWFNDAPSRGPQPIVTSEVIYYWMVDFGIPFIPAETWHFNRLMNLIQICGTKRTKPKKMSRQAQAEEMRRINAQRRSELGTTG